MSLVSVEELIEYMSDIRLTTNQRTAAQYVIDGVQQELENHLNRPLEPVLVRESLLADGYGFAYPTVSPIHEVRSVERLNATPVTYEAEITPLETGDAERSLDLTWNPADMIRGNGLYLGYSGGWYSITYVGGYKGYVDAALKLDIMRVCAREMTNNHDDTLSIKTDFATEPNTPPVVLGWTEAELKKWDRLRRRVIR